LWSNVENATKNKIAQQLTEHIIAKIECSSIWLEPVTEQSYFVRVKPLLEKICEVCNISHEEMSDLVDRLQEEKKEKDGRPSL
jgi:lysyl-tRNA synthetase class I